MMYFKLLNSTSCDMGKEVIVVRGRKAPLNTIWEIVSHPTNVFVNNYFRYVAVDIKRGDSVLKSVSIENLEVHKPNRYIEGPIECENIGCSAASEKWNDDLFVVRRIDSFQALLCRSCYADFLGQGRVKLPQPKWAKESYFDFKILGQSQEEINITEAIHEEHNDVTMWLLLADYLDELGDNRSNEIRIMVGAGKRQCFRANQIVMTRDADGNMEFTGFTPFQENNRLVNKVILRNFVYYNVYDNGTVSAKTPPVGLQRAILKSFQRRKI
jgi:uncharacterized protein (TIGR02996 family)